MLLWRHLGLLLAVVSSLTLATGRLAAAQSIEYEVKANYLVRFAAFVDWPADAFPSPETPLWLCVAGKDSFGATLERAAEAQSAHGRPIRVRRLAAADPAGGCHMLYIGQGGATILQRAKGQSGLLVVTDSAVSPQRGAIHFVINNGNVRFHIDAHAAAHSKIAISSRLLNLALTVRRP